MQSVRPPRQNSSISHCNEVAHRLHQWQGSYRFNLYNECNLLLSATCFLPGTDMSKASRDRRRGGWGQEKMNVYVCWGRGWVGCGTCGLRGWWCGKRRNGKSEKAGGKEERAVYVTPRASACVTAVGRIAVQGEDHHHHHAFVCSVERPPMINVCHG